MKKMLRLAHTFFLGVDKIGQEGVTYLTRLSYEMNLSVTDNPGTFGGWCEGIGDGTQEGSPPFLNEKARYEV
jgi:hypothetical protein